MFLLFEEKLKRKGIRNLEISWNLMLEKDIPSLEYASIESS